MHFRYSNGDRWTVGFRKYECPLVVTHGVLALAGTDLAPYLAGLGATLPKQRARSRR